MPYLAKGDTGFHDAVDRWFHYRSKRLDNVTGALKTYQNTDNQGNLQDLLAKMRVWKTIDPKEYRKRGKNTGAYSQLLGEVRTAGAKYKGFDFGIEPPDPAPPGALSASGLVQRVSGQLNAMKDWACLDATMYKGAIFRLESEQPKTPGFQNYQARVARILDKESRASGGQKINGASAGLMLKRYNWSKICGTGAECIARQAAVCFSFAQAAAYILGGKGLACIEAPRIEVVALKNHVFCLVGRTGEFTQMQTGSKYSDPKSKINNRTVLPPPREWGATTIVVDGWIASLGYPKVIYDDWFQFPMRNEPGSQNLFSYYDNFQEDDVGANGD